MEDLAKSTSYKEWKKTVLAALNGRATWINGVTHGMSRYDTMFGTTVEQWLCCGEAHWRAANMLRISRKRRQRTLETSVRSHIKWADDDWMQCLLRYGMMCENARMKSFLDKLSHDQLRSVRPSLWLGMQDYVVETSHYSDVRDYSLLISRIAVAGNVFSQFPTLLQNSQNTFI